MVECKAGVLQQADGSATCDYGSSSVLVGVYGPCAVRANRELHNRAALDVTVQYAVGRQDNHIALIKRIVTCACEKAIKLHTHPHTAISIAVFIKKEDKNLLSCTLTACCIALLDAGISMTSTFAAVAINPYDMTNETNEGEILLVIDCKIQQLMFSHCTTPVTETQFLECLMKAQNKLAEVKELYQTAMTSKLSCLIRSE